MTDESEAQVEPHERPQPLNDEQVARAVHFAFQRVERLRDEVAELDSTPQTGSPLAGDDRATDPYKTSHAVVRQLQVSTEHLDAIRVLIQEVRILHPSAPFTLARASLETGAAAVWLLAPKRRTERVLRTLRHAVGDAEDSNTAIVGMGLTPRRPVADRRAQLRRLARSETGDPHCTIKRPKSTAIISATESAVGSPIDVLAAWRVCSGFAHGRTWPMLSVLDREEFAGAVPGERLLKVTSSLDRVLWVVWAASDVTEHGLKLFRERAASPYSRPGRPA